MVNKSYDKIFDDLETAITFGEAVDYIAKEKTVTAGAADNQYPIFPTFSDAWDAEKIGFFGNFRDWKKYNKGCKGNGSNSPSQK